MPCGAEESPQSPSWYVTPGSVERRGRAEYSDAGGEISQRIQASLRLTGLEIPRPWALDDIVKNDGDSEGGVLVNLSQDGVW